MHVLSQQFAGITATLGRLFNLIETNMNAGDPLVITLSRHCGALQSMLSGLVNRGAVATQVQVDENSANGGVAQFQASFFARFGSGHMIFRNGSNI